MNTRRSKEIIAFAHDIRRHWGRNPIAIADRLGIKVVFNSGKEPGAQIIKTDIYPIIISIYGCDDAAGRQVLCAHELGHALLHDSGVNHFNGSYRTIVDNTEYEANLFAVALLFNDSDFAMPIAGMSNYLLKSVLDYNVKKQN